jgi:signal transduction histidine kinase
LTRRRGLTGLADHHDASGSAAMPELTAECTSSRDVSVSSALSSSAGRVATDATRAAAGCALGAVVVAFGALALLAGWADAVVPDASSWSTSLDLTVGLAFAISAVLSPGPWLQRGLVAGVGAAWLVGSFVPDARLANQAVLMVALVAFPTGRPRQAVRWVLVAMCVPVGLLLVPQLGVVILFCAVAVAALSSARADPPAALYPFAAAMAVAGVRLVSWLVERLDRTAFDPAFALTGYEFVLVGIAIAFPFAMRTFLASRSRLADQLLSDVRLVGLEGLAVVLRDSLRDPRLRVYRWQGPQTGYVDGSGRRATIGGARSRWLYVDDGARPLGAVEYASVSLDDPATAAAVTSAVQLSVVNLQLQELLRSQLSELEAAQSRLVAATDEQRTVTAARLREDVVSPLEQGMSELRAMRPTLPDGDAADAVDVVIGELAAACDEVIDLVAGVPPAELKGALLLEALHAVARRSPVPVTLDAAVIVPVGPAVASAIYYVCSEALVNAAKHADATRVDITLRETSDAVVVTIADDGCGGADPSGSGLQGLSDRLASTGGRLRVDSPVGAGTTIVAWVAR